MAGRVADDVAARTKMRASGSPVVRGSAVSEDQAGPAEPVVNLGARLKHRRQLSGMSLREVARQLAVSPSFVSQLENGKSQPSVATLYSIAQLLDVSIDELFAPETSAPPVVRELVGGDSMPASQPGMTDEHSNQGTVSRSALGSPADAWPTPRAGARLSVTRPGHRVRLEMNSGVVWEQLATNTGVGLDFIEVVYPPHSTSTTDNRMLQHAGSEFGYLIEGELEITVGFEVVTLHPGDAIGFDSAMPHLLSNRTDAPARGIWCVRHPHG
jgi:transcriptional regulator with XRE-family HTH domain/quercetin dioxygenase-like cupin family protein